MSNVKLRYLLGLLCLFCAVYWAVAGCSSAKGPRPGPTLPGGVKAPLALTTANSRAHLSGVATPQAEFDLLAQVPLLTDDKLVDVRRLVEAGDADAALKSYEALLSKELSKVADKPRYQFFLGKLREDAKRYADGNLAFERASKSQWPLQRDSIYRAARTALRSGNAQKALRTLAARPLGGPLRAQVLMLRAEAQIVLGLRQAATRTLKELLGQTPPAANWPRASQILASTLLELALAQEQTAVRSQRLVASLEAARAVSLTFAGTRVGRRAATVEQNALAKMTEEDFARHSPLTRAQHLTRIRGLASSRRNAETLAAVSELLETRATATPQPYDAIACEARLLRNKAWSNQRKWGQAADAFSGILKHCKGADLRARALYLAGKYAMRDRRYGLASRHFRQLEQEASTHRLADDARLKRAQCARELGDEATFTELLSSMAAAYPAGDMVLDGVFQLALRRIERRDWAGAAAVLENVREQALRADVVRDHEYAGRENYFLARAWIETGERERGLREFERLIAERPFSFYMQNAYARLREVDPQRARRVMARAIEATEEQPFRFVVPKDQRTPTFLRIVELLGQSELSLAQAEVLRVRSGTSGVSADLLWAVALLFNKAGSSRLSHRVARGELTDWLGHWPVGEWHSAWSLAFPRPFRKYVTREANKRGVSESLIYAIMREESGFDPKVVSPANAYGLMQLIKSTAKHYARKIGVSHSVRALKTPKTNIALGAAVISDFRRYFPEDPLLAVPSYNAGPGRPLRWLKNHAQRDFDIWVELIPFRETNRYTKRVLSSRGAYAFLYESQNLDQHVLPVRLNAPIQDEN